MLAGAPTRVLELKVALKPFGPVACLFFFSWEKKTWRYTRHMHAWHMAHGTRRAQTWIITYPNPVPAQRTQSCGRPCVFQRGTHEQSHQDFEHGGYLVRNNTSNERPGKSPYPLPPKKHFQRTPRATHCTDRAQTSLTVSGRPSFVDLLM